MGCNQSKQEDQIAADFFGGKEDATLEPDSSRPAGPPQQQRQQQQPKQQRQQQQKQSPPQQQQQRSSQNKSAKTSLVPKKAQVRQSNTGRKSEFVAPPSSMSFIESAQSPPSNQNPISPPPAHIEATTNSSPSRNKKPPSPAPPPPSTLTPMPPRNNRNITATVNSSQPKVEPRHLKDEASTLTPLPPRNSRTITANVNSSQPKVEPRHLKDEASTLTPLPPRNSRTITATVNSSQPKVEPRQVEPRHLEDDDFSVAPSLDVAMRSIIEHNFDDVYKRGRKLGYGAFADVFIGLHKPTGSIYAVKQVDRSKMMWGQRDALKDEIENLKKVREGPNIVQLYEVFEEDKFCYLVCELMPGGELFDRIIEKKTFTEEEARSCCQCVLSALDYMHQNRVAHRDLKPENLLLADQNALLPVKLADFGFAKTVAKKNGCRTLCGTPGYLAPEILERWPSYDVKCDVWSVGVILFLLLGGYLPFDDDDEEKVFDRTRNGQYDFRPQFWRHISNGAKDLVSQCLTINPNKRASSTSALNHEWMSVGGSELATHQVDVEKLKVMVEARKKMKAAVTTLVAANRLQQLNDDFTVYMDKRRGESIVSHFSYMTNATRTGHTRFVEDSPSGKPFHNFYTVEERLGEGENSYIYRAIRKQTKQTYAVKHTDVAGLDKDSKQTLRDEVRALRLLRGGPHIIRLFDIFQEPDNIYMIMEEMKGGNLLSRIVEKEVYTEREARQVCKIAFTAINYCHRKKVAHRDVKPENFLLVDEGDDTSVKLADFAFAKKVTKEKALMTLCGTAQYVAPEILDHNNPGYDHRCDIWSLGVFCFVLLGGYPPFEGVNDDLATEIRRGVFDFHDEYWSEISSTAKKMISSLLVVDPAKRVTAADALSCEWMAAEEEQLVLRDLSLAQDSIKKHIEPKTKVKMAIQMIIARNKFMSIAGMGDTMSRKSQDDSVIDEDEPFTKNYTWGEQIGIGTFSVVHEVTFIKTNKLFAAKQVSRKDLHPSDAVALHDEISALQQVTDCEHIVKLYDVYDEPDYTVLVMECMGGGDLIDRIIEKRHYTEFDAKEVSRKLILGVAHCHKRRIANRNVKPESLLLKAGSDTDVKISDFGYAKTVAFPNALRTQCGTEGYVAPEILEHRPSYDVACDMWSLGVVIYIVLGGYRPFRGEGDEVMKQIRYGEYKFHKRYWSHVSKEAKSLITQMLTVDPEKRITAEEALNSDWIKAKESALETIELSNNMTELKEMRSAKAKLRGAVNTVIAAKKFQSLGGFRAHQDF